MTTALEKIVYISAWNDSGGGFLQRLFEGHSDYEVLPYELQLGREIDRDGFSIHHHQKYRWPNLPAQGVIDPLEFFDQIIDEEQKILAQDRLGKFKHYCSSVSPDMAKSEYLSSVPDAPTLREVVLNYIESWLRADGRSRESIASTAVAHCPVICLDFERILAVFPDVKMLHVVRSPFTGFADMRRRHSTIQASSYALKWTHVNTVALHWAGKYPESFRLVMLDELLSNRRVAMTRVAEWLGIEFQECLLNPSWDGELIEGLILPFGGVSTRSLSDERKLESSNSSVEKGELDALTLATRTLLGEFSSK